MKIKKMLQSIRYSTNPYIMNLVKKPIFYMIFIIRMAKLTRKSRNDHKLISQHKELIKDFKKAFYQFSYSCSGYAGIYINAYLNKSVKPVNVLQLDLRENDPILLCTVKDDLAKVKLQVEHHRRIGIKHFVYIDNISKDGTFEWLKGQNDVSLFTVDEIFSAEAKNAWRRQITDLFGYDRWYLVLDSDELFTYPGIETRNINRYIDFLEKNKIKSTLSPMIDMYSKGGLFEKDVAINTILEQYCYFDVDTYYPANYFAGQWINGGPRMRIFSKDERCFPQLSKYALTKFSRDMLIGTHQNYPYKYNFNTKGAIAFLLHYKFLHDDSKKYKKYVMFDVMSNNSVEYKQYMKAFEQNSEISFYYEGSQKLNNSMDLMKINIINKNFFENFLAD